MHSLLELEALQAEDLLIISCMTLNELLTSQTYNFLSVKWLSSYLSNKPNISVKKHIRQVNLSSTSETC